MAEHRRRHGQSKTKMRFKVRYVKCREVNGVTYHSARAARKAAARTGGTVEPARISAKSARSSPTKSILTQPKAKK